MAAFGKVNLFRHSLLRASDEHGLEAEALMRVLIPLEQAIRESAVRIKDAGEPKDEDDWQRVDSIVDEECGYVEDVLGAAFVLCQRYITQTVSRIMALHDRVAKTGQPFACLPDSKKATLLRTHSPLIGPPGQQATHVEVAHFAQRDH